MAQYMYMIFGDESEMANATEEDWALMMKAHSEFAEQVTKLGGTIVTWRGTGAVPDSDDGPRPVDGIAVGHRRAVRRDQGGTRRASTSSTRKTSTRPSPSPSCLPTSGGVEVRPVIDTSGG